MIDEKKENQSEYEEHAQLFKLLSHPARLAILEILQHGEECVCHMEAVSGFRQAYLSQQLAVLREAGLILDRREGWNIFYRVADEDIYTVIDAVRRLTSHEEPPTGRTTLPDCPCPKCGQAREDG